MWVLIAILAVPVLEIALFVQIGGQIGVLGTVAQVLASAVLGVVLMRAEPHRNADSVRAALAQDRSPASPMAHSALRMIAALLILLPGFFTDTLGLLLLLPPLRAALLARMVMQARAARPARDDIIEGEYDIDPRPGQARAERLPPRATRAQNRD